MSSVVRIGSGLLVSGSVKVYHLLASSPVGMLYAKLWDGYDTKSGTLKVWLLNDAIVYYSPDLSGLKFERGVYLETGETSITYTLIYEVA